MSKSTLRATALIGGSQVINLVVGLVRSKAVALILGPTGTGLIAALQSTVNMTQQFADLGVSSSSVRDIAQAHAEKKTGAMHLTVSAQRMAVVGTGILGFLLTFVFAKQLSILTFDNANYTVEIQILAIAVFFNIIRTGQTSLIQGVREVGKLAKLSIFGAVLSTIVSIPFIYYYDIQGVTPYLVVVAVSQYLISVYYARQINIKSSILKLKVFWPILRGMVKLGLAFMLSGLAAAVSIYLIRIIVIREFDLVGAGLYQAAFSISGMYINVILQAMGKDFYPRLAAVAYNPKKETELLNEQAEIGMILAAPGLLATLALAPWAIELLYTSEYLPAYSILRWMIFGVFLKTISWPMGYFFVARGKGKTFLMTEVFAHAVHIVCLLICVKFLGLTGTGIAMLISYLAYLVSVYFLVNRTINFDIKPNLWRKMVLFGAVFTIAIGIFTFHEGVISSLIVLGLAIILGIYAVKKIMQIMQVETFVGLLSNIKNRR